MGVFKPRNANWVIDSASWSQGRLPFPGCANWVPVYKLLILFPRGLLFSVLILLVHFMSWTSWILQRMKWRQEMVIFFSEDGPVRSWLSVPRQPCELWGWTLPQSAPEKVSFLSQTAYRTPISCYTQWANPTHALISLWISLWIRDGRKLIQEDDGLTSFPIWSCRPTLLQWSNHKTKELLYVARNWVDIEGIGGGGAQVEIEYAWEGLDVGECSAWSLHEIESQGSWGIRAQWVRH